MKRRILVHTLLAALSCSAAMGQFACTAGSAAAQKLVCQFPFATGVLSNQTALGTAPAGGTSVAQSAVGVATTINIGIATQVSQLPLASASAGNIVHYKAGVQETYSNLGPILTDRAETVGRHKLFLGFTASQFVFTDIDGYSLGSLPFGFVQPAYSANHTLLSNTFTTETTNMKFKIDQFIGVATFGVTGKVDVSVIVPVERVSVSATTTKVTSYLIDANNNLLTKYTSPSTWVPGSASGVGDINVNVKSSLWNGEQAALSAAVNVRVPSGDDLNLLGSGAWGFNPYIVYSYLGRVSPHAKIGYQWNTSTELNRPLGSTSNQVLPGGVQYDLGADWAAHRRVTIAVDLLGSQFLNTPRLIEGSVTITPANADKFTLDSSTAGSSSFTISNLSTGLKWNPFKNLVLSGNVLFQLNNNGLRSRPTPLLGISCRF